ncbi:MAG: fasciclin domain-containing protein [Methanomicrobiaceae archaeon]|nr:fasciclin domain-containing protein [Methanomicrobiaceae archaeon]
MCLIIVGLCIVGTILIAGCAEQTTPEATPAPTEEVTPMVPEITPEEVAPAEETTPGEVTEEATPEVTEEATEEAPPAAGQTDIFGTLETMPEYSTLRDLLVAAGLDQTLSTDEVLASGAQYTLFAPNNGAFSALEEGTEEALMADIENLLTPVLSYHVVEGVYTAEDLQDVTFLDTLEGTRLSVVTVDGGVTVDGIAVVEPDILATNGVIHGIDAVLIPPGMTVTPGGATEEANETSSGY